MQLMCSWRYAACLDSTHPCATRIHRQKLFTATHKAWISRFKMWGPGKKKSYTCFILGKGDAGSHRERPFLWVSQEQNSHAGLETVLNIAWSILYCCKQKWNLVESTTKTRWHKCSDIYRDSKRGTEERLLPNGGRAAAGSCGGWAGGFPVNCKPSQPRSTEKPTLGP